MNKGIVIREDISQHMAELKQWLCETESQRLEEMADFFKERVEGYEEHMSVWKEAYRHMATLIPESTGSLLDLGCGTGLELDEILLRMPDLSVTGIDLSESMLSRLRGKHPAVRTFCADYFTFPFDEERFDTVISVESLHHFKGEKKLSLFEKIRRGLRAGGIFLEADYIACCDEEETLLREVSDRKRKRDGIPEDVFVHFDTPLTCVHEMELLQQAGFATVEAICSINGATFIRAL